MITYESLIETVSEIVSNPKINKENLSLVYKLPSRLHRKMNETVFYKLNPTAPSDVELTEEFEVEIGGILITFLKQDDIK